MAKAKQNREWRMEEEPMTDLKPITMFTLAAAIVRSHALMTVGSPCVQCGRILFPPYDWCESESCDGPRKDKR